MGRNRFVQASTVRLELSDVYKRRLEDLKTKGVKLPAKKDEQNLGRPAEPVYRAATEKELADAQRDLEVALADGAWIEVKSELTAGETIAASEGTVKPMHFGDRPEVDLKNFKNATILAFVTAWSLEDAKGPVPFDANALDNVDPETWAEINQAVDWHENQVLAAREARKNATAGRTKSEDTSLSVG